MLQENQNSMEPFIASSENSQALLANEPKGEKKTEEALRLNKLWLT